MSTTVGGGIARGDQIVGHAAERRHHDRYRPIGGCGRDDLDDLADTLGRCQ